MWILDHKNEAQRCSLVSPMTEKYGHIVVCGNSAKRQDRDAIPIYIDRKGTVCRLSHLHPHEMATCIAQCTTLLPIEFLITIR